MPLVDIDSHRRLIISPYPATNRSVLTSMVFYIILGSQNWVACSIVANRYRRPTFIWADFDPDGLQQSNGANTGFRQLQHSFRSIRTLVYRCCNHIANPNDPTEFIGILYSHFLISRKQSIPKKCYMYHQTGITVRYCSDPLGTPSIPSSQSRLRRICLFRRPWL